MRHLKNIHRELYKHPKKEVKEKKDEEDDDLPPVSFFTLFRYATTVDKIYIAFGSLTAIISGGSWPIINIFFGNVLDLFVTYEKARLSNNATDAITSKFISDVYLNSGGLIVIGVIHVVTIYAMFALFALSANNQIYTIRVKFFRSVLRQEIGWFDSKPSGDFASRITADLKKIDDGIGERLGLFINALAAAFVCCATAFYYGWKLTLVVLSVTPVLVIASGLMAKIQSNCSRKESQSYGRAGSVAHEVLSSIKTVYAFDGQRREVNRYEKNLIPAMENGIKRNFLTGLGSAILWSGIYVGMALGVWYGTKLILDKEPGYTVGTIIIIFWNVIGCGYNIGNSSPHFEAFQIARGGASIVFDTIERQTKIDSESSAGDKIESFDKIKLVNVHFSYPTRKEVKILKNLNLEIKSGETVGLVGRTGSGKSTVIQLLQRFYDPDDGDVYFGDKNLKDLNLGHLRKQIGVVGQEPVLFDATIEENIKLGTLYNKADHSEVERAGKEANAEEFISQLPLGYKTWIGDSGANFSGGQKQRIAIARALISKPSILLLDEATSALDMQSESIVQDSLDRARHGRTTVIVAHRLSTVRNVDRIVYMEKGAVLEMGTHDELMEKKGKYYKLTMSQEKGMPKTSEDEDRPKSIESTESMKMAEDTELRMLQKQKNVSDEKKKEAKKKAEDTEKEESKNKVDDDDDDDDDTSPDPMKKFSQLRLLKMLMQDKVYVFVGIVCAAFFGIVTPIYAYIFGDLVDTFAKEQNSESIRSQSIKSMFYYLALGGGVFIAAVVQMTAFGVAGERLTLRLRKMAYESMLKQEVAWYDKNENSAGHLCARLSTDAANVQGASGSRISILTEVFSTFFVGAIIGLSLNLEIALLNIAFFAVIVWATSYSSKMTGAQFKGDQKSSESAVKLAVEAISNIRTVASLHQEKYFLDQYSDLLEKNLKSTKFKCHKRSIALALAMSVNFFAYAGSFMYGGHLLAKGRIGAGTFFKIIETMIYGATVVGQSAILTSDYTKAKMSAANIFAIIDRKPKVSQVGEPPAGTKCDGDIAFQNVHFSYPDRAEVKVLKGVSFSIKKGKTLGIVGQSGCGKSTSVQLMERFYDPTSGEILLDGKNIANLNIRWLRLQLGLVSQEPVLFSYSIRENIAYGDNNRDISLDEIIEVARQANIHDYIIELPMGYDTPIGSAKLSGGQKQRIAIARALVRKPHVLVLDEATSALDTAAEKIVQEALNKASVGRTCMVIAHRLSTIKDADKIVVLQRGVVVEEGTHDELLERRGAYYHLYSLQG